MRVIAAVSAFWKQILRRSSEIRKKMKGAEVTAVEDGDSSASGAVTSAIVL